MLREVLEEALKKGEKLRDQIVSDLASNRRFLETVAKILESKKELVENLRGTVQELLKIMRIPTTEQLESYRKRIEQLEKQINLLSHKGRSRKK